jgi:acylphosphatase
MTDAVRAEVRVDGIVQGVGFRPLVYRTATARDLADRVQNRGDAGVAIIVEGSSEVVDDFLSVLRTDPPPLARVQSVAVERVEPTGRDDFEIADSTAAAGGAGTVPPDTGVCQACLDDVREPTSRFHAYWATAVPSRTGGWKVRELTRRIPDELGLEYAQAVEQVEDMQPRHELANSYQKRWNVRGAFELTDAIQSEPVLLVDGTVGSRWTFTEVAVTLRDAGCGPVYPFAL